MFGRMQKISRKKYVTAVVVLNAGKLCQQGRNYPEANGAEASGPLTCRDPFQGPGRGYIIALEMT
jgi:hypothetical protein